MSPRWGNLIVILHLFLHRCHPYGVENKGGVIFLHRCRPAGAVDPYISIDFLDIAQCGVFAWVSPQGNRTYHFRCPQHLETPCNQPTAVREDSQGSDCGILVRYTDGYRFSKR